MPVGTLFPAPRSKGVRRAASFGRMTLDGATGRVPYPLESASGPECIRCRQSLVAGEAAAFAEPLRALDGVWVGGRVSRDNLNHVVVLPRLKCSPGLTCCLT